MKKELEELQGDYFGNYFDNISVSFLHNWRVVRASKQTSKKIHLIFFWLGLCMDTTGTILMGRIAKQPMLSGKLSAHGVTGAFAIILMIVHAIWATVVLVKDNQDSAKNFHRFSIAVWVIWLVPYVLGMIMGMR